MDRTPHIPVKLSIITPVFNGERFIESCLQNVIAQNCDAVEHVVVDGGSIDNTVKIIKRYAEKYSHIRWVSEKDEGQSDAMNKGIRMARGRVLGMLNSDDFYNENVLCRIAQAFAALPEPSFLFGNCDLVDEYDKPLRFDKPQVNFYQLLQVWRFRMPNPSSIFYHRSLHALVGEYDTDNHYTMDYDFLLRVVQVANLVYVDETLGGFRYYPGTKTFDTEAQGTQWRMITSLARKYAARKGKLHSLYVNYSIALQESMNKHANNATLGRRAMWKTGIKTLTAFDRLMNVYENSRGIQRHVGSIELSSS